MNLLVAYDRARAAIAEAKTVKATLQIRDHLDHVKLHAKQVQDRDLAGGCDRAAAAHRAAPRRSCWPLQSRGRAVGKGSQQG
jgi:hypothetical protein